MAKYRVIKAFVDKENNLEYVAAGKIIDATPARATELTKMGLIEPYKDEKKAKAPTTAKNRAKSK